MSGKPLVWLRGEIKTPPLSGRARIAAGVLLRELQSGNIPKMPFCGSMPQIGRRCYELRINDEENTWRIIVRLDDDAVVIVEVFKKKSRKTPHKVIEACKQRLRRYDLDSKV